MLQSAATQGRDVERRDDLLKTGLTAIAVLAVLGALVVAAPGLAQPGNQGHDRDSFNVGNAPFGSCADFFSQKIEEIDGWSGQLHESWTFSDPLYSNVSVFVNGTWTDPATGLSYHIHFKGDNAQPDSTPHASGDVDIRRSDGMRLTGTAEFIVDHELVSLDSVSCG
jgi:hypothetical protein